MGSVNPVPFFHYILKTQYSLHETKVKSLLSPSRKKKVLFRPYTIQNEIQQQFPGATAHNPPPPQKNRTYTHTPQMKQTHSIK